uniref:Uncharacterized protein n=1 Tax=Rhipicephalus zambeziensis TaxID=60191 RepID=A0A224YRB3_9ACAR
MIVRDSVAEGSRNFDYLGFFNMHLNLSTRPSNVYASIENAAAAAGIRSHDLRVSSRALDHCDGYVHARLVSYEVGQDFLVENEKRDLSLRCLLEKKKLYFVCYSCTHFKVVTIFQFYSSLC